MKKIQISPEATRVILLVLGISAAVCAGLVPTWTHADTNGRFSVGDQVILGLLVFVAFQLGEVSIALNKVLKERAEHALADTMREECDVKLFNIQGHFHQVIEDAYGTSDLFVNHFLLELRRIEASLKDAAQQKKLRVEDEHFLAVSDVLSAFDGDNDPTYRYTWPVSPHGPLFITAPWRKYFQLTAEMVKRGRIRRVEVLIIVQSNSSLDRPEASLLLDFYRATSGFDCKIVLESDWRSIARDNNLSPTDNDFGIYGSRLLYLSGMDKPPEAEEVGVFSKDRELIKRYTDLFEAIWSSHAIARTNPSVTKKAPTLDELFGLAVN